MIKVNKFYFLVMLEPLAGLADDDECTEYDDLNPNDELAVRQVIRNVIVPHVRTLTAKSLEGFRKASRYYLSKENADFERPFNCILPPFDPPDDPRLFFLWVWEECFPGEDYRITNLDDYVERPDISEPYKG